MEMPALPPRVGEPLGDLRGFVGGEVVEDDVNLKGSGDAGVDSLEELEDIDGSVTGAAVCEHLAAGDVERGKDIRGAMALSLIHI